MWYMDDGDIMCHLILVPSHLQEIDDANAKVGAERTPRKIQVICNLPNLYVAPPEWRVSDGLLVSLCFHGGLRK